MMGMSSVILTTTASGTICFVSVQTSHRLEEIGRVVEELLMLTCKVLWLCVSASHLRGEMEFDRRGAGFVFFLTRY
jgi:hypothetical protein